MGDYTIFASNECIDAFEKSIRSSYESHDISLYGDVFKRARRKSNSQNQKTNNNEMKQGLKIEYTNKSTSYGDSRYYVYYVDGMAVFIANQIPWPRCCGIAILKDLSISPSVDKTIFKKILDEICDDLYSNDKYSKLLFYTNIGNTSKIFETYPDITILDPFKNRRSGNILIGFEINLLKDSDVNPGARQSWPITIEEEDENPDDEDEGEEEDEATNVTSAAGSQRSLITDRLTPETTVRYFSNWDISTADSEERMSTGIFRSSDNS